VILELEHFLPDQEHIIPEKIHSKNHLGLLDIQEEVQRKTTEFLDQDNTIFLLNSLGHPNICYQINQRK